MPNDFLFRATDAFMPLEIDAPLNALTVDEMNITLKCDATVGNRTIRLIKMASSNTMFALANSVKSIQAAAIAAINADVLATDTNYATTVAANATTLASAYTLATDLKAKHNAILSKLDADVLVTDTNYAATLAIAAADATTPATLAALLAELRLDTIALMTKLEADLTAGYAALDAAIPAAPTTATTLTDSDTTVQASETVMHIFRVGAADETVANTTHVMNLAAALTCADAESIWITDAAAVAAAGDKIDVWCTSH